MIKNIKNIEPKFLSPTFIIIFFLIVVILNIILILNIPSLQKKVDNDKIGLEVQTQVNLDSQIKDSLQMKKTLSKEVKELENKKRQLENNNNIIIKKKHDLIARLATAKKDLQKKERQLKNAPVNKRPLNKRPLDQQTENSDQDKVIVIADKSYIRTGPNKTFLIKSVALIGDRFIYLKDDKTWVNIQLEDGTNGWIYKELVKRIHKGSGTDNSSILVLSKANIRKGPGTHFKIIKVISSGKTYKIVKKLNNWIKIKLNNGSFGWIHTALASPF